MVYLAIVLVPGIPESDKNSKCKNSYPVSSVTQSMFCALANDTDSCYGDSGGPFTVNHDGTHVLEGIISWGKNCAKPQWPGVYSRVGHVLKWIRDHTTDSESCWKDTIDSFLSTKQTSANVDSRPPLLVYVKLKHSFSVPVPLETQAFQKYNINFTILSKLKLISFFGGKGGQ